jgi:DNA-binding NtrC family response regulator
VIISTGYGELEAARHFAGKEMAGLLEKPYTVNQLMESIALVLNFGDRLRNLETPLRGFEVT